MLLRFINLLLLLAAMVGAFLAVRGGLEHQRLREDHRQLVAEVGLLPVSDPEKVHVLALKRDDPLDFAWQMYVPARWSRRWVVRRDGGSSSSQSSGDQQAFYDLVRVRFRKNAQGQWQVWQKQRNGSSLGGLNGFKKALDKPDELIIQQAATDGIVQVDEHQVLTLLKVHGDKPMVTVQFGTPDAFALKEKPWGWQEVLKAKKPK